MPKTEALIKKLCSHPEPRNFSVRELDALMKSADVRSFLAAEEKGISLSKAVEDAIAHYA